MSNRRNAFIYTISIFAVICLFNSFPSKVFDLEVQTADRAKAEADLKAMCEKLLANTVIENYTIALA